MNLLKRFVRNDNADFDESYDENELYVMPEDIQIPDETNSVAALENPARKDPEFRPALKAAGMMTRDARVKERKKSGQPGARRRFQFSKR